jgi:NAD(P)-dependent dehydrogenase (short-subunit alcohol dehydrogenase family)
MRDIGLDGRLAVVTGAAGGIGSAVVRSFVEAGASVLATDRPGTLDQLDELAQSCGGTVVTVEADISREADTARVVETAISVTGRLDALANVAAVTGVALTDDKDLLTTPLELWDQVMAVNLRGTMLMARHAVAAMIERGGGSVVNVSSAASVRGSRNLLAYSAAKAGVNNLTLHIARAFGQRGIRCNCVMPGMTEGTGSMSHPSLVPEYKEAAARNNTVGRLGAPSDIASLVVFLSSDQTAGFINGEIIACDGGAGV